MPKYHTEETKLKMSLSAKGKQKSKTHIENIKKARAKQIMKPRTDETKNKISIKNKNQGHGMWKGDKVGYMALHTWIRKQLGKPKECVGCGLIGVMKNGRWNIEYSNIDHKYERDVTKFIPLCPKCHRVYDRITFNK